MCGTDNMNTNKSNFFSMKDLFPFYLEFIF